MMNVVFISSQPYPYGMAGSRRIRLFAEYLARQHAVKVVITGSNNGKNPGRGSEKGVRYTLFKSTRLQAIAGIFRAKKILRENADNKKKNILMLYDGIGLINIWFAMQGRKLGYHIVTDVVEDYSLHKENAGILLSVLHKINARIEKRTYLLADGIVVLSTTLRDKFKALKMPSHKIELVPVSAENANEKVAPRGNKDHFTFAYSGSYGNKDGIEILLEAFRKLAEKKKNVSLVLSGKINKKTEELIRGDNRIRYAGMVPDPDYYSFLNGADALLMTRINSAYANAGFPFKLGEYLATGRAVIASRVSDVGMYLNDKEDALLVEGSSVPSLLSAMEFAVDNPESLSVIGLNGKRKCLQFFDPEKNGQKLEIFLKSV